jgi:hypothetical protein
LIDQQSVRIRVIIDFVTYGWSILMSNLHVIMKN